MNEDVLSCVLNIARNAVCADEGHCGVVDLAVDKCSVLKIARLAVCADDIRTEIKTASNFARSGEIV